MAKNASALGHFGLLLGLLAVIVELNQIVMETSRMSGDYFGAFWSAVTIWVIAAVLVAVEWFQTPRAT